MIPELPRWVHWITDRGIYGYTHRVVEWHDGRPVRTGCGRAVGERWRETSAGLRCMVCHNIYREG